MKLGFHAAGKPPLSSTKTVSPERNPMKVAGQNSPGTEPEQAPTPLRGGPQHPPLQIYTADRAVFGSTPLGGLNIFTSE